MKLTIAHLYPQEMNIYGDRGNIIALVRRCEWRGIRAEVRPVEVGAKFDFESADIIFGGGGQDRGQLLVGEDLLKHEQSLKEAAVDGVAMLLICGTYQLFGRGFTTIEGHRISGIGVFSAETVGSNHRMIGNIIVESSFGRLVGFENHSGETLLDEGQEPLGKVIKGFGNNYSSGHEGAIYQNAIGTYLHGPVLPKNPALADHLIQKALERRYSNKVKLKRLDDSLERKAAQTASQRPQ